MPYFHGDHPDYPGQNIYQTASTGLVFPVDALGIADFSVPLNQKKKTKVPLKNSIPDEDQQMPTAIEAKEGFLFGCDPELFVFDENHRPVPAGDYIPGTKENPFPVEYGAIQRDGFAAEFNIDPASNFKDWNRNINAVMGKLKSMLPKGYTLEAVPAVVFDKELFDNAPEEQKELGCLPDFNAWTGDTNPPPHDPENPYLRTAAGHIHIGWTEDASLDDIQHILNCRDLVKQMDWYLGGWSTKIDNDEMAITRRRLYGNAGACRYKSYGVEYRVLSNFWLTSLSRRVAVWNRMQHAISDMSNMFIPDRAGNGSGYNEALVELINHNLPNKRLMQQYRYPLQTIDRQHASGIRFR